ncbi:response regulator [Brockia lithotrophica]|uniref:Two-component system response regulator VicR n=1 Tax=Brockia lithotrophica TaxID=933949 RepID=A0A660KTL9_9BACL|nr:response regulator [Brockia lithotrophica]RKQ83886.1 two-component system response regulator VicR [Brockia lithotrophica]
MAETILIVEDEEAIAEIVKYHLEKEGFRTLTAYDGETGLRLALEAPVDLVILDLMLPKLDGFELLRRLRRVRDVPVLILTAKGEELDKVLGLELGADDYVTKPFGRRELIARVRAHLRRVQGQRREEPKRILRVFDLTVDLGILVVRRGDEVLPLTQKEFEVFTYLLLRRGNVVSREELLREVWGYEYTGDVRTVDVTIRRLREKVERDPARPEIVRTRRGAGYYIPHEDDERT